MTKNVSPITICPLGGKTILAGSHWHIEWSLSSLTWHSKSSCCSRLLPPPFTLLLSRDSIVLFLGYFIFFLGSMLCPLWEFCLPSKQINPCCLVPWLALLNELISEWQKNVLSILLQPCNATLSPQAQFLTIFPLHPLSSFCVCLVYTICAQHNYNHSYLCIHLSTSLPPIKLWAYRILISMQC